MSFKLKAVQFTYRHKTLFHKLSAIRSSLLELKKFFK